MAAAGFRTRRIKSEQSIGDRLKRARIRKKLSVSEVEEATKIRAKFLLALESDSWEHIPSEVYGRGYLEAYTSYLKLPTDEIMRDYDKMRSMYARHCQDGNVPLAPKNSLKMPKFILTPRFVLIVALSIGMLGFASVIGYQVRQFTSAPYLELITPAHAATSEGPELVVNTNALTVTGRTTPGAMVKVNHNPATVDEKGYFSYTLPVSQGLTTVVVDSTDKGKTSTELVSVMVK